jgi:O-antigen biosynthesis protein
MSVPLRKKSGVKMTATCFAPDNQKMPGRTMASDNPKVSVIIPTFNRPEMLVEAVKSVIGQTMYEFEVIVVNDGSIPVSNLLSGLDPQGRIRVIDNKEHRGRSASRNIGIRAARGTYIAYLDDDDRYCPDHLETLVGFLESNGQAAAYSDALCAVQEKKDGAYVVVKKEIRYSSDFCNRTILWRNLLPVLCLVHARSCCDSAGYFDEALDTHEDWDFIIRLSRCYSLHHLKKTTAEYSFRDDGSSTTSGNPVDFLRTRLMIYKKYREFARHDWRVKHKQRKSIRDSIKRLITQGFSKNELKEMVRRFS